MFDPNQPLKAFEFDGEVAVVTGGARGIGFAISQTLAAVGATVLIADLDADAATQAAEKLGERAVAPPATSRLRRASRH